MKLALRNKTAEKKLKMAIFKLLVLLYAHYPIYFFLLFEQYYNVLCCENTRKSLNQQIWVWHISKY